MTHTPGPYRLEGPTNRTVVALDGLPLMSINRPPLERDANARLIAAAPDLLRVARSALLVLLQHAPDDYTEATIRDLQVAIAKATEEVQT